MCTSVWFTTNQVLVMCVMSTQFLISLVSSFGTVYEFPLPPRDPDPQKRFLGPRVYFLSKLTMEKLLGFRNNLWGPNHEHRFHWHVYIHVILMVAGMSRQLVQPYISRFDNHYEHFVSISSTTNTRNARSDYQSD